MVCQALHVAVHTEPHVTPAAYPPAVQFNQADDMQPHWGVGGGVRGIGQEGCVNCRIPL